MYVHSISLGFGAGNLLKKGELAKKREYDMMKQTEEICVYLWDNYIEYVHPSHLLTQGNKVLTVLLRIADAKNIILMGVGDAYVGILYLLANRGNANPITVLSDGFVELISRISALQNVVSGLKELSESLARKTAPEPL